MSTDSFEALRDEAKRRPPGTAVVLGSGLGAVVDRVRPAVAVPFAAIPGFAAPTVHGHGGRAVLGDWAGERVLVFQGRMHFYEGHTWDRATAPVRLAAELGARLLLLTNAAGGIRDDLKPGDLMAIRSHLKLLDAEAWKRPEPRAIYSRRWIERMGLPEGVYAALTGPCYETPAEIRALRAMGADAVGMSTAMEAEVGVALGLEVAAVSCITNPAAGLSAGVLDHSEVQRIAGREDVSTRMANLVGRLIVESAAGNA
jgi:purine-nucleoside phosphorylase